MKSDKQNRIFNNEASRLATAAGVEIHVAKNVLRWRRNNRNLKKEPEYKKLTDAQWNLSPSLTLAYQIKNGTGSISGDWHLLFFSEELDYDSFAGSIEADGMVNCRGILYSKEDMDQFRRLDR